MSKKNNDNKTSLDDLKDDLMLLDNMDLNSIIGGTIQPVAFDTGLPGMVPQ